MNLKKTRIGLATASLGLLLAGCNQSGGASGVGGTGGDFVLLRVTPPNNSSLYLNDAIQFDFSNEVDPSTAEFSTVVAGFFITEIIL